MAYSLRMIKMALTTLVITAAASVHGDYDCSTPNSSWEEDCCPVSCCPESCGCGHFLIGAEALFLRAYEGGLSGVCDGTDIVDDIKPDGFVISTLRGKTHEPDFQWNVGFRVGVGYEFAQGDSGIGVLWTHFNSHSHSDKSHRNKTHWKINFDVVDALYGFELEWSNRFLLIPYGGLRYARIDQKLRTHFESTETRVTDSSSSHCSSDSSFSDSSSSFFSEDTAISTSNGHMREDFYGIGGVFGVEGDWRFGCGFSLYGDISLSALYGRFHVRSCNIDVFSTGDNINHFKKHLEACQAVVDSEFGIRWEKCFCNDKVFWLQLGAEQHRYFNFNQFCGYGDLCLDGVSLGIGLEF
jgi:hypothetical protein